MQSPGLRISGIFVTLLLLAGCATAQTDVKKVQTFYPGCDTSAVQALNSVQDKDWKTYWTTCATDRQAPEPTLEENLPEKNLDACRLVEASKERKKYNDSVTGFPRSDHPFKLTNGKYKISVVPIEWPDLRGTNDIFTELDEAIAKVNAWYSIYTRGKVSFEWDLHREWVTLPNSAANYSQSETLQNTGQWSEDNTKAIDKFWKSALKASDPTVDFSGTEMVFFILPPQQETVAEFNLWPPGTGTYLTDEGPIQRGFTPGSFHFRDGNAVWMFWIHEMLHYFKLPDLYWSDQNSVKQSDFTLPGPMQEFDILSNQSGATKSLNGWLMWIADWANEGELLCLTAETFKPTSFAIYPNHLTDSSLKSVIVKLSETSAVVIESRRKTEFDAPRLSRSREGVLVYHVNTKLGHGEGALTVLAPAGRTLISLQSEQQSFISLDAILYEGNSIDIAGYHITVNRATQSSDIVSISKNAKFKPGTPASYVCFTKTNRDLTVPSEVSCPIAY
jgi:M6 family metalloprotease-like protein